MPTCFSTSRHKSWGLMHGAFAVQLGAKSGSGSIDTGECSIQAAMLAEGRQGETGARETERDVRALLHGLKQSIASVRQAVLAHKAEVQAVGLRPELVPEVLSV